MAGIEFEDLMRRLTPQVLGAVTRRYGHFDLAEDATQEALVAAAAQWPRDGPPDNPRAWLITVASRRLTDLLRAEQARRRREETVAQWALTEVGARQADERDVSGADLTEPVQERGIVRKGGAPGGSRCEKRRSVPRCEGRRVFALGVEGIPGEPAVPVGGWVHDHSGSESADRMPASNTLPIRAVPR